MTQFDCSTNKSVKVAMVQLSSMHASINIQSSSSQCVIFIKMDEFKNIQVKMLHNKLLVDIILQQDLWFIIIPIE